MKREREIKKAQKYLDRLPDLILRDSKSISCSDSYCVEEIVYLVLILVNHCETFYFDDNRPTVEKMQLQCSRHKRRSIGDIYRIIKYQSKKDGYRMTSLLEIYNALENLILDGKVSCHICPDINCRVYVSDNFSKYYCRIKGEYNIRDIEYPDEFGVFMSKKILSITEDKINTSVYSGGNSAIKIDFNQKSWEEKSIEKYIESIKNRDKKQCKLKDEIFESIFGSTGGSILYPGSSTLSQTNEINARIAQNESLNAYRELMEKRKSAMARFMEVEIPVD